jgi:hypothetical protein
MGSIDVKPWFAADKKTGDYWLAASVALLGLQHFFVEDSTLSRLGDGLLFGLGTAMMAVVWLAGRDHPVLRRITLVLFVACGAGAIGIMTYEIGEVTIKLASQFAVYLRS